MVTQVALNFLLILRLFSEDFHLNGWFTPQNHCWLIQSWKPQFWESYYYATIKDNYCTGLLSTMVISQKAPAVEHCRPGYACDHVGSCFIFNWCNAAKRLSSAQYREVFTAPVQGHFHDVVTLGKCTNLQRFCLSEFRAYTQYKRWFY